MPALPPIPQLVDVEQVGTERFRSVSPLDWPGGRIFGGLVAAQALRAAGATVAGRAPHSLHCYFMRPGRPDLPLDHTVTRERDGRSFATRFVEVAQGGEVILAMMASFHAAEEGEDYQVGRAADAPAPDEDVAVREVLPHLQALTDLRVRDLGPTTPRTDGTFRSTRRMWLRVDGSVADDPLLHACIVTFMSDMGIVSAARPPTAATTHHLVMAASIDHAIWFHRPARADDWLLYDLHSLSVAGARALARGVLHDRSGRLVASVTQEALVRSRVDERATASPAGPEI